MFINFLKKYRARIFAFSCWAIVLGWSFWFMKSHDLTPLHVMKSLYRAIADTWYGPLLFTLVYIIRPIFLFPASILYVLSGVVYGFWGGFLYTLIGASISALIAYAIGRYFAKDFQFDGKHRFINTWKAEIKEHGFTTVLFMRLLYLPFDVVNYGAAILNVRWKPFLLATFLSMIVDTGAFISFGATLKNVETFELSQIKIEMYQLLMSVILLIFSLIVAFLVHRHRHKKKLAIGS